MKAPQSRQGYQLPNKHTPSAQILACLLGLAAAMLVLAACASDSRPKPSPDTGAPPPLPAPAPVVLPETFESADFIVTVAKPGDSPDTLAARYLGSSAKAWMIEEYGGAPSFVPGNEVVIPRRGWNPPGVHPAGYQLIPVLVYHNIGPQRKGRLLIAASTFEEQMRYLKAEGYRAVRLEDFLAYLMQKRQLPKKSVLITFDDGHKSFLQYARPLLKELGFPVVLFIQSDQIVSRPNANWLSWAELGELVKDNVEVQTHSKTHNDLRRASGEPEQAYTRRMQVELGTPLAMFRAHLPQLANGPETIAYPYGEWDENLLRYVKQYGYMAGFTVQGEANPAFVPLLKVKRSQVLADWTLTEFKRTLTTFQQEPILPKAVPATTGFQPPSTGDAASIRQQWAAHHRERSEALESQGFLGQALDESKIALTIDPNNATVQEQRKRLESRIENEVATQVQLGAKLAGPSPSDARRRFLAALALNPVSQAAFDGARETTTALEAQRTASSTRKVITHTVRSGETVGSIANLYYGERSLDKVIEKENGLKPGASLSVGRRLRIPEVPGYPFLLPD